VDATQMNRLDWRTITEADIPALILMENAARAVLETCRDLLECKPVCYVFCGAGNNGGDGYALARLLSNHGHEAVVIRVKPSKTEEAIKNAAMFKGFGQVLEFEELMETLLRPQPKDLIFDAIIGTGLTQTLDPKTWAVVDWINHVQGHKIALDIPTGINSSTGDELGISVKAERTVSFQLEKVGHHLYPGRQRRGELTCAKVSIVEEPLDTNFHLLAESQARDLLPVLEQETYKNKQGHLGVIAGSPGMMGASFLVGKAAMATGAGLVTLHVPKEEQQGIAGHSPELMSFARSQTTQGQLQGYQSLVVGCGLGRDLQEWETYKDWISQFVGPVVLDADGFYGIESLQGLGAHRLVLTPHLGEFEKISGYPRPTSNEERIEQARNFAVREGTTLVLKGPASLVVNLEGEVWINSTGNPGMATAGAGDVLSGVIGALLATGLEPFDAARLGCWLHGHAGDLFAKDGALRGLTAVELINRIPFALKTLETS